MTSIALPLHDAFRTEVRAFLDDHLPPGQRFTAHRLENMTAASARSWQATLASRGWGAPHWPVEHGGCDWSPEQRRIFAEETAGAGAPLTSGFGTGMIGPILIALGTEAQRREHLPRILAGERLWCQGYSEPGAGSDLASLQTRARSEGDHYRVDGQKLWTTQAHWADWMFCLVRTDASGRKQDGITFLLIDMRTPGIEVRPIRSIDGLHHLNEVFFDSVMVPVSNRIGAEGDGWRVAKILLGHERQGIANVAQSRVELVRLRDQAAANRAIEEPMIAAAFTAIERRLAALAALEGTAVQAVGTAAARVAPSLKLLGSELSQDLAELAIRVAGPASLPMPTGTGAAASSLGRAGEEAAAAFLFGRAHSIYGGTSEVQRSIVARLVHA